MKGVFVTYLLVFGVVSYAHAEVYKWVDDRGVTHYGETLPDQAKSKAKPIGISSDPPSQAEKSAALERLERQRELLRKKNEPQKERAQSDRDRKTAGIGGMKRKTSPASDPCEKAWEEFENSGACFDPFRNTGGTVKEEAFQGCKAVLMPDCRRKGDRFE